jgi:hypothetical protein
MQRQNEPNARLLEQYSRRVAGCRLVMLMTKQMPGDSAARAGLVDLVSRDFTAPAQD